MSHSILMESKTVCFTALPPLSLYIHIPWCVKKCPYCDFNSHEVRSEFLEEEYVAALILDLEMALPKIWGRKVYTVFFGGGTPSLLSGESIAKILRQVRMLLPLAGDVEITLEANPGTVETDKFKAFREAGVNRLSLGIQSFNDTHLKALGRIHSAGEAVAAIFIAQQHFDNINLDLMYGLPMQTQEQALLDVTTALSFAPQHLSCYQLTLEPNTLFYREPPVLPDHDAGCDMQLGIESLLAEHGYEHYETSAFALLKGRSRHNLNYWKFGDYLGIGAGAHSKLSFSDKIIREARYKQPNTYMQQVKQGLPVQLENEVSKNELPFEFMMNALRLNEGFDSCLFNERTSLSLLSIAPALQVAQQRGLLFRDHQIIRPTLSGQRFLNDLLEIFI